MKKNINELKYTKVTELISKKHTGYTTRLLEFAIFNPDCIILCSNPKSTTQLKKQFNTMVKELPLHKKIFYKTFVKSKPEFRSLEPYLDFRLEGVNKPVFYNNYTLQVLMHYHATEVIDNIKRNENKDVQRGH